jgi:hypothetical protein
VVEAVIREPVSTAKFPANREFAGNFPRFWPRARFLALNPEARSITYRQIPCASEQGIFGLGAGNFRSRAGKRQAPTRDLAGATFVGRPAREALDLLASLTPH